MALNTVEPQDHAYQHQNQPSDVIQHYVEGNAESHNKHADDGCKDVLHLRLVWFLGLSCLQSLAIKFEKKHNTSLRL